MKRSFCLLLLLCSYSLLSAQVKLSLSGQVEELAAGQELVLQQTAWDGALIKQIGSIPISANGHIEAGFSLSGFSFYQLLSKKAGKENVAVLILPPYNSQLLIKVNAKGELNVKGSADTDLYQQFIEERSKLFKQDAGPAETQLEQARLSHNEVEIEKAAVAYRQARAALYKWQENFIENKLKNSPAALRTAYYWNPENTPFMEKTIAPWRANAVFASQVKALDVYISQVKRTAVSALLPDFSLPTSQGKAFSIAALRGQYVLVDVWAAWCRPCRVENPYWVSLYHRYKDKGFTMVGISVDTRREMWLKAIEKDSLTWTQVSDLKGWQSPITTLLSVRYIPQNLLLDKQGRIVGKNMSPTEVEKWLIEKAAK